MKIYLVTTQLGMGGAENQVCSLADGLALRGHNVEIVSLIGEPIVKPRLPQVRIHNLQFSKKSPVAITNAVLKYLMLIRFGRPDIIHSHEIHANIFALLCSYFVKEEKLIVSLHNTSIDYGIVTKIFKYLNYKANYVTNVSDEAAENYVRNSIVKKSHIATFYNGIDINRFRPRVVYNRGDYMSSDSRLELLMVGRLMEQKDHKNMLKALKILDVSKAINRDWHLSIVGEGVMRRELEDKVTSLGLQNKVSFLGIRRDVPELMAACDVFVLSSKWEGMPLVVAEAMSCERVVVATDSGGVREVVGDAGFICPPQNAEALATALTQAMSLSAPEAEALGKKARNRVVQNFSLDAAVDRWLKLYTRI